jgi:hypothetical protein
MAGFEQHHVVPGRARERARESAPAGPPANDDNAHDDPSALANSDTLAE